MSASCLTRSWKSNILHTSVCIQVHRLSEQTAGGIYSNTAIVEQREPVKGHVYAFNFCCGSHKNHLNVTFLYFYFFFLCLCAWIVIHFKSFNRYFEWWLRIFPKSKAWLQLPLNIVLNIANLQKWILAGGDYVSLKHPDASRGLMEGCV